MLLRHPRPATIAAASLFFWTTAVDAAPPSAPPPYPPSTYVRPSGPARYGWPGVYPGIGVGVGAFPGVGLGPWGPWGVYPFFPYYRGFYSNGFSAYGPPVPTFGPVPGIYGGSDQRNYGLPPAAFGWGGWGMARQYKNGYGDLNPYPPSEPPSLRMIPLPGGRFTKPADPNGDASADPKADGPQLPQPKKLDDGPELPLPKKLDDAAGVQPMRAVDMAATLDLKLPDANAVVMIDGRPTKQQGVERTFRSPPLEPGQEFEYQLTARYQVNGQEVIRGKLVTVKAGQTVTVDLTEPPMPSEVRR